MRSLHIQSLRVLVFNATLSNISVISVEETGGPRRKPMTCRKSLKTLLHNVVSSIFIGTDCAGSCKSDYDTIQKCCLISIFCFLYRL